MKPTFDPKILAQHVAVLGKTGSGKTSTAKLAIEQVVADGARVCVLDPIKSDWWGIVSSADGKRPGLPFRILGGPHGHVPLHSNAGVAIAELVASTKLPHSVIDMAEFEPGGVQRFFCAFADTLLKRTRGVLYLVLEEAHEFAPKERAGFEKENLAVHYAKKLATAGRSKGIRLIAGTQRVQALHNAVLGSCDTLIAHRLTAPADQEPVKKWLKANVEKDVFDRVSSELASLKTGTGWICSGEARVFERVEFPRIHTFDNSATPTDDDDVKTVNAGDVDLAELRELIGAVVAEAEANDPKTLKARIRELEKQIAKRPEPTLDNAVLRGTEVRELRARITSLERVNEQLKGYADALFTGAAHTQAVAEELADKARELRSIKWPKQPKLEQLPEPSSAPVQSPAAMRPAPRAAVPPAPRSSNLGAAPRRILIALAQNPEGITHRKAGILADVSPGGSTWRAAMALFRRDGLIVETSSDSFRISDAGLRELGEYEPLPTGDALREYWRGKMNDKRRAVFDAILAGAGAPVPAARIAAAAGVELGGSTWRAHLAYLRGLELVSGSAEISASEVLFG